MLARPAKPRRPGAAGKSGPYPDFTGAACSRNVRAVNAVLIPVRSVSGAKNRLGNELDDTARERLTLSMLADMISAARAARRPDLVCVVSGDRRLLEFARAAGAETLL